MDNFISTLESMIVSRKKMTSPLYQVILNGQASKHLLRNFFIHRYPIKNLWTRNILGIASRIDDYELRCDLVANIYEEETGELTNSKRHLETFVDFGRSLGVTTEELHNAQLLKETKDVMEHNLEVCNSDVHFTAGVASVLLLMEGQPPIVTDNNKTMEFVMRTVYKLPPFGYEFFVHHASQDVGGVSALEDEHADTAKNILRRYCVTESLRQQAVDYLQRAIDLRHQHFMAIYNNFHVEVAVPFEYETQ